VTGIRNIRFIFFFLALVLFFFIGRQLVISTSDLAGYYVSYLVYPVLLVQNKIVDPIKAYFRQRKTLQGLKEELDVLRVQKEELQADVIALKSEAQYYKDIDELLAFKKRYLSEVAYLGQILFRQFSCQAHFFLVNRGHLHGIKTDMVAIYKNCLLGRVSEVYPWYCKVVAITDRSCKVAAYCAQSMSCGVHSGTNYLEYTKLKRISHLSAVKEGDLVLSSGKGMVFPRGFGLGCIKTYKKKVLWYKVGVEPLVNLREISYCLLINKEVTC